ncbi:MAG: PAS domain S-box protein [Syntrophomonas sp.]|uniref:PAS domain S-box protein n=1 Tax=Syntrophomonas sp. TaxID=2053627 RepID=UPI00262254D7|nr:PAS domain S-box protein [Syntrophomonas sp.]MDD4626282.1 PAS domain S-box protein [Syntrophomonas sp.]
MSCMRYRVIQPGEVLVFSKSPEDIKKPSLILSELSEKLLASIFDSLPDAVLVIDINQKIIAWNRALAKMTGITAAQMLGKSNYEYSLPFYGTRRPLLIDYVLKPEMNISHKYLVLGQENDAMVCENIIHIKGQEDLYLWARAALLYDQNGELMGAIESIRNITKRRQVEKALAAGKERLAQILGSISHGVITTDNNGVITFINTEAERFFEWKNEYAQGKSLLEVVPLIEGYNHLNRSLFLTRNQKQQPVDIRIINNLGQISLLSTTVTHIQGENGNDHGMVFVFRDVTELRKAESQLALSQKLESIGQLAAGIAHEINNPMQYIGDNLSFLNEAFANIFSILDQVKALASSEDIASSILDLVKHLEKSQRELDFLQKEIPQAIQQSLEGVIGVSDIVTALRNFAHPGSGEKQITNINNAIMGTVSIAKNEWKHLADLELNLDNGLPAIRMVVNQINQVLLNMIVNASHSIQDAIEKGLYLKGKITISSQKNESYVEILISDNGMGIPAAITNKIFDPFFTTKEVGKGTGQGLAISHDIIVNKHNGSIELESEVGQGTTFYIRLPIEGSI